MRGERRQQLSISLLLVERDKDDARRRLQPKRLGIDHFLEAEIQFADLATPAEANGDESGW